MQLRKSIRCLWSFKQTYRLNFSSFKKTGRYYLQAGGVKSPEFEIGDNVYKPPQIFVCVICGNNAAVSTHI
jgi:hypothetical protein